MLSGRKKILLAIAALLALIPLSIVVAHYRAKWRLENYKKQLLASGEKLEIADLIPDQSKGLKAGRRFLDAAGQLQKVGDYLPPQMRGVKSGRAMVAWKQEDFAEDDSRNPGARTNYWPVLRSELSDTTIIEALREMQTIALEEKAVFEIDYLKGFSALWPHLAPIKRSEMALAAATMLDLHEGKWVETYDLLRASIAMANLNPDEPLLISQLVRMACASIAIGTTWNALQKHGWSDDQLLQLQKDWSSVEFLAGAPQVLAMERAMGLQQFNDARDSYDLFHSLDFRIIEETEQELSIRTSVATQLSQEFKRFMNSHPAFWAWKWIWSYEDERMCIQLYQEEIEAIRHHKNHQEILAKLDAIKKRAEELKENPKYKFAFDTHGMMTRSFTKFCRTETDVQIAITAIALERFRQRNQAYPKELPELIPNFLDKPPLDYMDGNILRYRLQSDGSFLLYSVGEDRKDDGGDGISKNGKISFYTGRDFVWPQPATGQEIKEFEDKQPGRKRTESAEPQSISPNK